MRAEVDTVALRAVRIVTASLTTGAFSTTLQSMILLIQGVEQSQTVRVPALEWIASQHALQSSVMESTQAQRQELLGELLGEQLEVKHEEHVTALTAWFITKCIID